MTDHGEELLILGHMKLLIDSYIGLLRRDDDSDPVDWLVAHGNYRESIDRAMDDWQRCYPPETVP